VSPAALAARVSPAAIFFHGTPYQPSSATVTGRLHWRRCLRISLVISASTALDPMTRELLTAFGTLILFSAFCRLS
jgi:hypothetical protein